MIKKPNLAKQTIDSINIHESRNEASTEFLNCRAQHCPYVSKITESKDDDDDL